MSIIIVEFESDDLTLAPIKRAVWLRRGHLTTFDAIGQIVAIDLIRDP